MSPELQMLLQEMREDIRDIGKRTVAIEKSLERRDGSASARRGLVEAVKWCAMLIAAAFAGHVGAAGH